MSGAGSRHLLKHKKRVASHKRFCCWGTALRPAQGDGSTEKRLGDRVVVVVVYKNRKKNENRLAYCACRRDGMVSHFGREPRNQWDFFPRHPHFTVVATMSPVPKATGGRSVFFWCVGQRGRLARCRVFNALQHHGGHRHQHHPRCYSRRRRGLDRGRRQHDGGRHGPRSRQ